MIITTPQLLTLHTPVSEDTIPHTIIHMIIHTISMKQEVHTTDIQTPITFPAVTELKQL